MTTTASSAFTLMVQGTASDAGKTTLVAGLCRVFARRGLHVAPFKPQNMALNSAVTSDGGEIGRAQALQAVACGVPAHTDFNPVLLKPQSNTCAQVIVQGKALSVVEAKDFFGPGARHYKQRVMTAVLDSFDRLRQAYELVLVEGAGSPAEINLRDNDIANMGFAEAADCPVILVADIDKGGVFAQLYGTLMLLSEAERARIKGMVINRFRGDIRLLENGLTMIEELTGKPVLGVLPYLDNLVLDAEDAIVHHSAASSDERPLRVVVLVTPRISNHTDFDVLRLHPRVELTMVHAGSSPAHCSAVDLVILPGSKAVRDDLAVLKANGWKAWLDRHLRYGGKLIGICGGYQMLGDVIDDPQGIESTAGSSEGLGYLPMTTTLEAGKQLRNVTGSLSLGGEPCAVHGYEIHCGQSSALVEHEAPLMLATESGAPQPDGMVSTDNQVLGTYLHGLFDSVDACNALLAWAGLHDSQQAVALDELREASINRLADTLEQHLDLELLEHFMQPNTQQGNHHEQ
ncbi:cobyric acid synthase [Oceanimonas sp. CHS3-5]|uniref:cobyric acid synthase n=1 Tax=Oceanimonas sp. CHS3-5 TaxID=3068186 RepID=UPI00273D937B|nr:cobyric acid synthase [Oceanimonas sp. CHS3-5]MDP5291333.1 cobyric acid synthase [Oceanimonas sp. CHS3-5]